MDGEPPEGVVTIARVQVHLADGGEEVWMVPMALTDDALSYRAVLYPPEGAVIARVDLLKRTDALAQDVLISRAEAVTL